jgi:dUTPase
MQSLLLPRLGTLFPAPLLSLSQPVCFQRARGRPIMQHVLAASSAENVAPSTGAAAGSKGAAMEPPTKQARLTESFRVQRMHERATLPKRGSAKAAGYDIARCGGRAGAPRQRSRRRKFQMRRRRASPPKVAPRQANSRAPSCATAKPTLGGAVARQLPWRAPPKVSRPRPCPPPPPPIAAAAPSAEDAVVPARGKACISTGLIIAVPHGTYGRVAPRSGLAAKHFIDTGAGVVDEDYRGELKVGRRGGAPRTGNSGGLPSSPPQRVGKKGKALGAGDRRRGKSAQGGDQGGGTPPEGPPLPNRQRACAVGVAAGALTAPAARLLNPTGAALQSFRGRLPG